MPGRDALYCVGTWPKIKGSVPDKTMQTKVNSRKYAVPYTPIGGGLQKPATSHRHTIVKANHSDFTDYYTVIKRVFTA